MPQTKQSEWYDQWSLVEDTEPFLFEDWIAPTRLEDFTHKDGLECGCGGGQHTSFVAPYARHVTAVDLNTTAIARERTKHLDNVTLVEADIAEMDLGKTFDIVFSIGVVHHTDDPDSVIENLKRHVKPGGKLILWVYSREGNFLVRHGVEPVRKTLLAWLRRRSLLQVARIVTLAMYVPIYSLYRLPLGFLPYHEYLQNSRRLSFQRNVLNVFDKMNAPQTQFISRRQASGWVERGFEGTSLTSYLGVSWRVSGTRSATKAP